MNRNGIRECLAVSCATMKPPKHSIIALLPLALVVAALVFEDDVISRIKERHGNPVLTVNMSRQSLEAAKSYVINAKRDDGSFPYRLNALTEEDIDLSNQFRQAFGVWGAAQLASHADDAALQDAYDDAMAYYERNTRYVESGAMIVHPDDSRGTSGAIAAVMLALLDAPGETRTDLLEDYAAFLLSLKNDDGHYYETYRSSNGVAEGGYDIEYEGAILVAFIRSAKVLNDQSLQQEALALNALMWNEYIDDTLRQGDDDNEVRTAFSWLAMAASDMYESGWTGAEQYANGAIRLAMWMKHVRGFPNHSVNAAEAYPGFLGAYALAISLDHPDAPVIRQIIERGLWKCLRFQSGMPHAFNRIASIPTSSDGFGGSTLEWDSVTVRPDLMQKTIHSMLLAQRHLF